jgi:hypothetical protein
MLCLIVHLFHYHFCKRVSRAGLSAEKIGNVTVPIRFGLHLRTWLESAAAATDAAALPCLRKPRPPRPRGRSGSRGGGPAARLCPRSGRRFGIELCYLLGSSCATSDEMGAGKEEDASGVSKACSTCIGRACAGTWCGHTPCADTPKLHKRG